VTIIEPRGWWVGEESEYKVELEERRVA